MFWGLAGGSTYASMAAAGDAAAASGKAGRAQQGVRELEANLDRALLTCEAMWTILRDKLGVTDEELIARVNEIDLSDGRLDGKVRKTPVSCPKCKRTISPRFPKCMYCGQAVMHDPFV